MDLYNHHNGLYVDSTQSCSPGGPPDYLEHWVPLTPLEQMENTDYDVIIVGSGAGGGAVLWRLCNRWRESGKRIAMLERGDLLLPSHAMNLPTFNFERLARFIENPKYKRRIKPSGFASATNFAQFFALGGRTIHWGVGSPRFHPSDFATWPISYRDLKPYYKAAEQVMGVGYGFTRGSRLQAQLLERLRSIGYVDAQDFPLAIHFGARRNGLHFTSVFSSIDLLGYSLSVKDFDLAVNARVVQVLTENGAAAGVKVIAPDRKSYIITGKHVVLAASTLGNPHILLHSGLGTEAVGRYLTNHTSVFAQARFSTSTGLEPSGNVAILLPRTDRRLFQIEMHRRLPYESSWAAGTSQVMKRSTINLQGFGIVQPRAENRVVLDTSRLDESGIPNLNVHFTYSGRDLDIAQHLASSMERLAYGIGIALRIPPCLNQPGADYHESGTCRMGKNPSHSVTNQFGELHDVSNVFVADSSVLPFIGATNPTLTIVALAIRTADYIHFKGS